MRGDADSMALLKPDLTEWHGELLVGMLREAGICASCVGGHDIDGRRALVPSGSGPARGAIRVFVLAGDLAAAKGVLAEFEAGNVGSLISDDELERQALAAGEEPLDIVDPARADPFPAKPDPRHDGRRFR